MKQLYFTKYNAKVRLGLTSATPTWRQRQQDQDQYSNLGYAVKTLPHKISLNVTAPQLTQEDIKYGYCTAQRT